MPTRNVVLTEHQHELIDGLVASGRYQNASEVLREGLRLVEARERLQALKLEALRRAIDTGVADLEEGRFTEVPPDGILDLVANLGNEAHEAL
ncbi:type II toxin-antitoxin system ParD family antitoxin [Glutamicibacter sp. NPDC087344]|uniref:type II toxin-antitoxin system ParD family antitoxin n=1 Tax=Glutamicibacter sp. NPDC087344 TaxID=3363994 RepID=UPI00380111F6